MAKTLIHNIGTLVTGDIDNPILEADAVLIKDGVIERIDFYEKLRGENIDSDINIRGMTLCPGLVDAHAHLVIGDWTPRLLTIGWMQSTLHGGVTTLISQGEVAFPGRPRDASGVKALAILARKTFSGYRPGGIKAHAGALMLEEGLTENDIKEVADEGVWLIAEVGLGSLKDFDQIKRLVQAARQYGMKIPVHFGPAAFAEYASFTVDEVLELNPDVIVHLNGGPTASSLFEMRYVIENSSCFLELICGNCKALRDAASLIHERDELRRVVLGTDSPTTGSGVMPQAIMHLVAQISSVNEIPAASVLCMATGNTARAYGLNTGMVKPGREADLLVIDAPPGSQGETALKAIEVGDCPHLGMVMVDGKVITRSSKNALNTAKKVLINGQEEPKSLFLT